MKHAPKIAGGLLGLLFIIFGLNFFLKFIPIPSPPEGSPPAIFMGAMFMTGYLTFVKILEIVGGILVAVPKTRNIGLLVLGPVIVNILAFHAFMTGGAGFKDPVVLLVTALSVYLLWVGRNSFLKLLN